MDRPSKDEMLLALEKAEIDVPPTASIAQIRTLHDDAVASGAIVVVTPESHNLENSVSQQAASDAHSMAASTSVTYVMTAATTSVKTPEATSSVMPSAATTAVTAPYVLPSVMPAVATTAVQSPYAISSVAPVNTTTAFPVPYVLPTVTPSPASPSAQMSEAMSLVAPSAYSAITHFADENVVDAELRYLRKQQEILALPREVGQTHQFNTSVRIEISAIESMVQKFTGDDKYDIRKWINDLEDAFAVLGFDDRAKLVSSRRLLDGTVKIFLQTVSIANYVDLKKLLLDEFGRVFTLQEVYHQLKAHRRKPTDSIRRYVIEMQEIAMQADFPEAELIDFIIQGIGDTTGPASMLYSATNMTEFQRLLNRYERLCIKPIQARTTLLNMTNTPRADQKSSTLTNVVFDW